MVSSGESQVDWTVSRCFRLLRPIASRKSMLRSSRSEGPRRNDAKARISPKISRPKFGDSPNPRLDPDWMAKPRKLALRQYAKKASFSSSDPVSELSAGELSIPTPIVARIQGAQIQNEVNDITRYKDYSNGRDIFAEKFVSQVDELNFRSQKLIQGTMDLVEATNTCQTLAAQNAFFPSSGAKSLRAMCCRRYARHIVALEDEQEMENADEKFDIATEAYTLVEETFDMGAGDYLRAITREYGIALLEKMIVDSRIPRSHVLALVRRMRNPRRSRLKHPSTAEVDTISAALLRATTPDKSCCNRDNIYGHVFNSLAELSSQCEEGARTGFEFRQFENLIVSLIPVCWFGSRRLTALWTNAFRAFVDSARSTQEQVTTVRDASRFLDIFISLDCGIRQAPKAATRLMNSSAIPDYQGSALGCPKCPKMPTYARFLNAPTSQQPHTATNNHMSRKRLSTALNNSLSSLFSILASFAITWSLYPEQLSAVDPQAIMRVLGCLSMDVLLALVSSSDLDGGIPFERCTSILGATLITLVATQPNQEGRTMMNIAVNDLVKGLDIIDREARTAADCKSSTLELLPELIFSTVRSSGRLLKNDGFAVLSHIAVSLMSNSTSEGVSTPTSLLLADLAVSSVQIFAERTISEEAYLLATQLEKEAFGEDRYNSCKAPFKSTPRPRRDREGLKWEDGICEWVEATPGAADLVRQPSTLHKGLLPPEEKNEICRIPPQTVENKYRTRQSFVFPSDNSSVVSDEELSQQARSQEAVLSSLLLSPDSITATSPLQPQQCHNSTNPIVLVHLAAKPSFVLSRRNAPDLISTHSKSSAKRRKPFADLTNLNEARAHPEGNKQKTSESRRKSRSNLVLAEPSSEDSDDELLLSRPQKRRRIMSKAQGRLQYTKEYVSKDGDELNSASEDSLFTSQEDIKSHNTAVHQNPRGKLLRTLSGKQCDPSAWMKQSDQVTGESEDKDTDDELGFECDWLMQRIVQTR